MNELIVKRTDTDSVLDKILSVQDNYTFQIRHFAKYIKENRLPLNLETVRTYLIDLNKSDFSASGKRVKRQALKSRLKALTIGSNIEDTIKIDRLLKQLDDDPATKSPKVATQKIDRTRVINETDFEKLVKGCRSDRQRRFIEFMYMTGARVSEMLGIKNKNIRSVKTENGELAKIRIMGKGKKERFVFIPVTVLETIKETFQGKVFLFSTSTGHPYNRSYVTSQIRKIGKKALRRSISAHTLRHSFATRMIAQTRKVQAVSQYLGHSSSSITLDMYVHEELSPQELFGGKE